MNETNSILDCEQFYQNHYASVQLATARTFLADSKLTTPWVCAPFNTLDQHANDLKYFFSLPLIACMAGAHEAHSITQHTIALLSDRKTTQPADWRDKASAVATEAMQSLADSGELTRSARSLFIQTLLHTPNLRRSILALGRTAVVQAWTSFETTATDLWVGAVNRNPHALARTVARPSSEQIADKTQSKQIALDYITRFDFDLRERMGEVLRSRFDFNSLAGIRQAYKAAFPSDSALHAIFTDPDLSELEATRHVIVHRAAIADEAYCRRVPNGATSGTEVVLHGERLNRLMDSAWREACKLLQFVESWQSRIEATRERDI